MTREQENRIKQALVETLRYINKEEKRAADLRPAAVTKRLAGYHAHKDMLIAMLESGHLPTEVANA